MAVQPKNVENTGFSANTGAEGSRIINPDGSANLRKSGISFLSRLSVYHTLLRMPRTKFFILIFAWYTTLNLLFATIYYSIGVYRLAGTTPGADALHQFIEAFFFSSQTLTTVGYGHVAPIGLLANSIASLESFMGIIMFALVTGIFYGRFARPKAFLLFSDHLLVSPFREGRALMLRLASYKNNHLTSVEAELTVAMHVQEAGRRATRFYPLPLNISKINSLALSWTLVHPIDADSPLSGLTEQELRDSRLEVIVNIRAFDDHFSNTVQQRTSYTQERLIYGARFTPMFQRGENGDYTLLELDKIDAHERVLLPDDHVQKPVAINV